MASLLDFSNRLVTVNNRTYRIDEDDALVSTGTVRTVTYPGWRAEDSMKVGAS